MSRQWMIVGVVVLGLAGGAFTLTKLVPQDAGVVLGKRAPDFAAVDLASGDSVRLRERYAGHVTLVNVWATWCVPCKTEMPAIEQAYERFKDRGFKVAAVSIDDGGPEPVRAFVTEMHLSFDILHDRSTAIQQIYQTTGVPESFLLDRDGVLIKRVIGAYDWASPASTKLIERTLGGDAQVAAR